MANFYRTFIIHCQLYCTEKTRIKEKEAGNGPFKKKIKITFKPQKKTFLIFVVAILAVGIDGDNVQDVCNAAKPLGCLGRVDGRKRFGLRFKFRFFCIELRCNVI